MQDSQKLEIIYQRTSQMQTMIEHIYSRCFIPEYRRRIHPGEILSNLIEEKSMTVKEFASSIRCDAELIQKVFLKKK